MAITNDEIIAAVNAAYTDATDFAAILKLLSGYGVRLKLEVQRDEMYRQINDANAALQARQAGRQTENVADAQETQTAVNTLQAQAAALQAQIDAINASLPQLLQ